MMYVPGMITVGFIVVRLIIKFAASGGSDGTQPKVYSITSSMSVDKELLDRLQLKRGDALYLSVNPDTNIVEVKANGVTSAYEVIGTIQDTELAIKVESARARAKIKAIFNNVVDVDLMYE